jgi:hypothetical protein
MTITIRSYQSVRVLKPFDFSIVQINFLTVDNSKLCEILLVHLERFSEIQEHKFWIYE